MLMRVTLADCSAKIGDYLDARMTHEELVTWSRAAMAALDIPALEYNDIMSLLQDVSASTPESMRNAAKNYRAFTSPLRTGFPRN